MMIKLTRLADRAPIFVNIDKVDAIVPVSNFVRVSFGDEYIDVIESMKEIENLIALKEKH